MRVGYLMSAVPLKLIVGLGNPGPEYAQTRHNAGFWLVDELAARHGGSFRHDSRHQGELTRVRIAGEEVWLFKPMTYMNCSGGPTRSLASFYKVDLDSVLVAHDELDFPPGQVKMKKGGGGGGNGLRDVIAHLGDDFWRIRIGIGHPGHRSMVLDYVLGRPSREDAKVIGEAVEAAADIVPIIITEGPQKAMNRLHSRNPPTTPPRPSRGGDA
jgi:peptidyl-tRNA hydrolase, PTH1 family